MINTIIVGKLHDEALIAAVGIGNMTANIIAMGFSYGLNSTLDTLVPPAYGSKNIRLCGEYMYRGRLLSLISISFISIFLCNSWRLFEMIGFDPAVLHYS